MKRLFLLLILSVVSSAAFGRNDPSKVCAPLYFGPNALPAMPVIDALVPTKMSVTLAGNYYKGTAGDWTVNPYFYCSFPFAARRMSLNIYGVPTEFYRDKNNLKGQAGGDLYVTTDIQMCRERRYLPDILVRAGIKSASGGSYEENRYFDCPGYFFDALFGRSVKLGDGFINELRGVVDVGFLCWQLGDARQNDALMYGAMLRASGEKLNIEAKISGYNGWRQDGDKLCFASMQATWKLKHFAVFADYGRGLRDYPFERFSLGISIPIMELNHYQK